MNRHLETPTAIDSRSEPQPKPRMASVEFFLVGDRRNGAEIEDELTRLDGVHYTEVDADRLHVHVTYDPGVISPGRLLAASKTAGWRSHSAAHASGPPR